MKKIDKMNRKGFTLLEVMVVVAIIVILAGISFINVSDALTRSNASKSAEESRFVTQVQSQGDYIRYSMLSGTPHFSSST